MIRIEFVESAKRNKIDRFVSAMEDQDFIMGSLIDKMPTCQEKKDLVKLKKNILKLLAKAEGMLV